MDWICLPVLSMTSSEPGCSCRRAVGRWRIANHYEPILQRPQRRGQSQTRGALEEHRGHVVGWNLHDGSAGALQICRVIEIRNQDVAVMERPGACLEVALHERNAVGILVSGGWSGGR